MRAFASWGFSETGIAGLELLVLGEVTYKRAGPYNDGQTVFLCRCAGNEAGFELLTQESSAWELAKANQAFLEASHDVIVKHF